VQHALGGEQHEAVQQRRDIHVRGGEGVEAQLPAVGGRPPGVEVQDGRHPPAVDALRSVKVQREAAAPAAVDLQLDGLPLQAQARQQQVEHGAQGGVLLEAGAQRRPRLGLRQLQLRLEDELLGQQLGGAALDEMCAVLVHVWPQREHLVSHAQGIDVAEDAVYNRVPLAAQGRADGGGDERLHVAERGGGEAREAGDQGGGAAEWRVGLRHRIFLKNSVSRTQPSASGND
jgi:hypothetical protein